MSLLCAQVLRDTRLLENLDAADARTARSITISSILGTDMIHHFSQISDLRIFYEANGCLMPECVSLEHQGMFCFFMCSRPNHTVDRDGTRTDCAAAVLRTLWLLDLLGV